MDTHKILMISVIVLAVVHALLSGAALMNQDKVTQDQLKTLLIVSVVVCLVIAALAGYCMSRGNSNM